MPFHSRDTMQKAFSLMELLLVIFIISLVYFLGFSSVEQRKEKTLSFSPLTIKETIVQSPLFPGKGTFMCTNQCTSCYFQKDISTPFQRYEGNVDLPRIKVYTVDRDHNLKRVEYGRYHDEKVCLLIDFFRNGSSTQLILETEKGIYFLPSYFGKPQEAESLEAARELWLAHIHDLDHRGDYY